MSNKKQTYHIPVMLQETMRELDIQTKGVYVDVTYGGGGHSKSILNKLSAKGRLYGFDQDRQAISNIVDDDRLVFVHANFKYLKKVMAYYGIDKVDGILADLGVSSFHFDAPERGFSYRFDTELDMRMNQLADRTAADVLNGYTVLQLQEVFSKYGELRNSKTMAKAIVERRQQYDIRTAGQLMEVIDRVYRGDRQKYASQVFQALRIEVNDELGVLETFLNDAIDMLTEGGRLVVISYHSLEDKITKRVFRSRLHEEADEYGRVTPVYKEITRRPMLPTEAEMQINSRAASAKMRVIRKL